MKAKTIDKKFSRWNDSSVGAKTDEGNCMSIEDFNTCRNIFTEKQEDELEKSNQIDD